MRRRPTIPLLLGAALAGAVVALVLALAARGDAPATGEQATADPARPALLPPRLQRSGPGWMQQRAVGPVRIEARAADPRGGPAWAVRVFRARRSYEQAGRVRRAGRGQWCAQLGRVVGGRFGWIDASNRFRPTVGTDYRSNPYQCAPLRADLGGIPRLVATNRVTDPRAAAPRPLQTAIWGFAGSAARDLRLTVDGVSARVGGTPHNVVLRVPPAGARRIDGQLRASYEHSPTATADTSFRGRHELLGAGNPRALLIRRQRDFHSPRLPLAGAVPRLEYRVADPVRGIPLGVVAAPAEGGGWCVSDAHEVVGERVGQVDRKLGTFDDAPPSFNNGCRGVRDRGRALSLTFGYSMESAGKPPVGSAAAGVGRAPHAPRHDLDQRHRARRRRLDPRRHPARRAHDDGRRRAPTRSCCCTTAAFLRDDRADRDAEGRQNGQGQLRRDVSDARMRLRNRG